MNDKIFVNTRSVSGGLTGVQRYTIEITARLGSEVQRIAPLRNAQGARGHLWEQVELPRLIRDALLWSPANTGPLRIRRQVVTIHDVSVLEHPEWFSTPFARWYRFLLPRLCARAAAIIVDSEFTRGRVIERLGAAERKVSVVHPGVDERFRPADPEHVMSVRKAMGLPQAPYLLSVSSIEPRKNLPRLLEAWERALPLLPKELVLVVAGAPGGRRVFNELGISQPPPRVILTGHVADGHLPALFSGADAFVYPSVYEGFGLPPLEAMASGTPVIAGNRTSIPEVLGDAAILVDPFDVEALAEGIVLLMKDGARRAELTEKGMLRARRFTWDAAADAVLAVLEEH